MGSSFYLTDGNISEIRVCVHQLASRREDGVSADGCLIGARIGHMFGEATLNACQNDGKSRVMISPIMTLYRLHAL